MATNSKSLFGNLQEQIVKTQESIIIDALHQMGNNEPSIKGGTIRVMTGLEDILGGKSTDDTKINAYKNGVTQIVNRVAAGLESTREQLVQYMDEGTKNDYLVKDFNPRVQHAKMAAIAAASPFAHLKATESFDPTVGMRAGNEVLIDPLMMDAGGDISYKRAGLFISSLGESRMKGLEAYDTTDNASSVESSVAFNFATGRQDPVGELLYPTISIPPDVNVLIVPLEIPVIYDFVNRESNASPTEYKKQRLTTALIDSNILKKDGLTFIPVVRDGPKSNEAYFVDAADIAPTTITREGESIITAPLKFGAGQFGAIEISQTDSLLARGIANITDSIQPAVSLKKVYLKLATGGQTPHKDILEFNVDQLPPFKMTFAEQGQAKQLILAATSNEFEISATTKTKAGGLLTTFDQSTMGTWVVKLQTDFNGRFNTEMTTARFSAEAVGIHSIYDSTNPSITLTLADIGAQHALYPLIQILTASTFIGYDLNAYRTNFNKREMGQLLDSNKMYYRYPVPYRQPYSRLAPAAGPSYLSDVEATTSFALTTQTAMANSAITQLLRQEELLNQITGGTGANNMSVTKNADYPSHFGPSVELGIIPYYRSITQNVNEIVNNNNSSDLAQDIRTAIINLVRHLIQEANMDSRYGAIKSQLKPNSTTTKVAIITDPNIYNWLFTPGDTRTLGDNFIHEIVPCYDQRVMGKMYITFIDEENRNTDPSPFGFGFCLNRPEILTKLMINRNGSNNIETTVQPAYMHYNVLPLLININLANFNEAVTTASLKAVLN